MRWIARAPRKLAAQTPAVTATPGRGRREDEEADPEDHQDRGKLALGLQVLERARPDGILEFDTQSFLGGADVRVLAEQGSEAGDYACRVGARGQRDEKL